MRQETINIYQFEELNEKAQETALEWYRNVQDIHWGDEAIESLTKFCEWFGIELCDWSYGLYDGVTIKTNIEYLSYGDKDVQYSKKYFLDGLSEDCPFTGYCMDETLLDPIRKLKSNDTYAVRIELLQSCLDNWVSNFEAELEHQQTDEYIKENIICNEYEFLENGKRYV